MSALPQKSPVGRLVVRQLAACRPRCSGRGDGGPLVEPLVGRGPSQGCGSRPAQARLQPTGQRAPWQRLYFLPEPHGQRSLRPTLDAALRVLSRISSGATTGVSATSWAIRSTSSKVSVSPTYARTRESPPNRRVLVFQGASRCNWRCNELHGSRHGVPHLCG